MMNSECKKFIADNAHADTAALLLSNAGKQLSFDLRKAVMQIDCRRKTAAKIPSFLQCDDFYFADTLCAEQASHEAVARFHASLAYEGERVLDMTAGLGIDAMSMARAGAKVTAAELDSARAAALRHNAEALGIPLHVKNADSTELLRHLDPAPDTVFIDPARRDTAGKRTFGFADCTPNLLQLLPLIMERSSRLLVKASPMLDITQVLRELPGAVAVSAVSVAGECKELLIEVRRQGSLQQLNAVELGRDGSQSSFSVTPAELDSEPQYICSPPKPGMYLYEPSAAVMKLAPWGALCSRFPSLRKLAAATHLFVSPELLPDFPGRILRIESIPDRAAMKALKGERLNICTRNYPLSPDALASRFKLRQGSPDRFIYGCRCAGSPLLIIAGKVRKLLEKFNSVTISKPSLKRKTGLDEALEDVAEGRVFHADSVDDLFNQLEK